VFVIPSIATVLAMLPAQTRVRIETFAREARSQLGDDLISLVVYGSAVRGGLTPHSDVDVLAVVRRDDAVFLARLHGAASLARAAARLDLRVLHVDEIARAADVFPLFFDDVRTCHAVLVGVDPFKDLVIHDEHRRLRVEQELREARQGLRRLVIEHAADPPTMRFELEALHKRIRGPLHALLLLHKSHARSDLTAVLDVIGARLGVDTVPLTSRAIDALTAVDATARLLDAAIADVDHLQTGSA
jgi:predicted nucleotidyltransferase